MDDNKLGILLLIIVILLLGFTWAVNETDFLGFLDEPLVTGGFGPLCDSYEECASFCLNNFGQCSDYCDVNPENELCSKIVGNLR